LPTDRGGPEVKVMYVDTNYHFDMLSLVKVLEQLPEERVRACLGRLFVVLCSSSVQLLLTLHYLENTFCSQPALCLLVIDSISAFYWVDRSSGEESVAKQEAILRKCSEPLARLLRDYLIVVFATTHANIRNYGRWSSSHASDFDKAYISRDWQRLVTHKETVSTAQSSSFRFSLGYSKC
uniref:X-ray repair cross complementing 2 n=1 Tax=Salmo trutta TaxID=8032 RepID=A0A673YBN6_SALTR